MAISSQDSAYEEKLMKNDPVTCVLYMQKQVYDYLQVSLIENDLIQSLFEVTGMLFAGSLIGFFYLYERYERNFKDNDAESRRLVLDYEEIKSALKDYEVLFSVFINNRDIDSKNYQPLDFSEYDKNC